MGDADLLTRPSVATESTDDGDLHILDAERNPVESLIWTALCGAQCFAWDDGEMDPADFDFYYLGHGDEKATCRRCRAALRQSNEP
jgi:hypothetical protein